ncbi:MAG: signal peptidase II [Candidatus Pacebacteria bacterium]|nr:signal peptidase II [Candidatus Paceibacterota bacterium]PIR59847.1 MAG: hypothetical protein COU68_03435 [Candidatus Pacebacteria bacterium CG10_big_fil_rev_8_21_14_0_10_45_6]
MVLKSKSVVLRASLIASGIVVLDQISKLQASNVTSNPGVGLGLAAQYISQPMVVVLTLFILFALWFFARDWWQRFPYAAGLFCGGALSNMLDRVFFGGVRDWLEVPVFGLRNNFADWAIFLSLIWILRTTLVRAAQKETT